MWLIHHTYDVCVYVQFIVTLEANILAQIKAVVNVTITQVVPGSVKVSSSVAFTGADSAGAVDAQTALTNVLKSGDVSSIFGTTFGSVAVSDVAQTTASNPSKLTCLPMHIEW